MSTLLSHFVPAYPSPSPCPQVHSLRLCLYSCPAPRFIRTFFFFRFHIRFYHQLLLQVGQGSFLVPTSSSQDCHGTMEKLFQVSEQWGVFHFEMSPFHKLLFFYVCKEHVLGVIHLLSSLGRMWVSCHHCFIVLGHVS